MSHDEDLAFKLSLLLAKSIDAMANTPVTVPLHRVEPDKNSAVGRLLMEAEKRAGKAVDQSKDAAPPPPPDGPSIRKTFDEYTRETSHRRPKGQEQVVNTLERFMKGAGLTYDSPVRAIVKPLCVTFKSALVADGLKVASVNRMLMLLNHWLKWCRNNDYLTVVPTEGLKLSSRAHRASSTKKEAFTEDDMRTILTHPHLTKRKDGRWRETYQCAMLTACTGARAGEVAQLFVEDIRREDGIDYMDINNAHGKYVKNSTSIRKVPLHSAFLGVTGFMDYVAEMRKQKGLVQLYPHIASKNSTLMTMFFTRLLKKHCGIVTKTKTQHSFRHWMNQALAKANVNPAIRHRIMGHAQGQGIGDTVYMSSLEFPMKELKAAMESVKIPGLSQ